MAFVDVTCARCGTPVQKDSREYNRSTKLGRPLYCTASCAAVARNSSYKAVAVALTCPCGVVFASSTKAKAAQHCSASCASHFSMNEERRAAQRQGGLDQVGNCIHVSEALKLREAWKYALLQQVLHDREHEFEYPLGGFVFDLALLDAHILVEFDGPEHWVSTGCMANDARKEQVAQGAGFTVVRVTVDPSTVIDPTTIHGL